LALLLHYPSPRTPFKFDAAQVANQFVYYVRVVRKDQGGVAQALESGLPKRSWCLSALFLALIACLLAAGPVASARAEYEPNDTMQEAFGPLTAHQVYTDKLDPENDKDFFFFYVTSPGQVTVSLRNLGGGAVLSYVGVTVLNASGISLGSAINIEEGEQGALALDLKPQKYFVEVNSNLDYGAGYSLEVAADSTVVGPFESISDRCAAARSRGKKAKARLTAAEANLQHANARLHRSRYSSAQARSAAQRSYSKAKARTGTQRKTLQAALAAQRPWCFITP